MSSCLYNDLFHSLKVEWKKGWTKINKGLRKMYKTLKKRDFFKWITQNSIHVFVKNLLGWLTRE
jgi:hypothetical protein